MNLNLYPKELVLEILSFFDEKQILRFCKHPEFFDFCKNNRQLIAKKLVLQYLPGFTLQNNDTWTTIWKQIYNYRKNLLAGKLRAAAEHGHLNIVQHLTNRFKKVYLFNEMLIAAAEYGHLDIVQYLIQNGKATASSIKTASRIAARKKHRNIVRYLEKKALNAAVAEGRLDVVKKLIQIGATDLNKALMIANKKGHRDIVHFLKKQLMKKEAGDSQASIKAPENIFSESLE